LVSLFTDINLKVRLNNPIKEEIQMSIFNIVRNKVARVVVVGAALVLIPASTALAGWGPARTTFTWNSPATYITFNSITDNPQFGDERAFFDGRDAASSTWSDNLSVSDNEELVLRIYYHNDASSNLNLVANNTRVRIALPHTAATSTYANAHISASNANPGDVADTVNFYGTNPFTMEYVPGSAQIWNNVLRGTQMSDDIVTSNGALVGYSQLDGKIQGCAEFSGYVTIKVRVHMQTPPPSHFTATATAKATANASAKASCPDSNASASASASATATATATATSDISQADADQKAQAAAQEQANAKAQADAKASAQAKAKAAVKCSKPVTTASTKPHALPNTGAGDVVGLFAGASAVGTAGHYFVSRRNRR
jgi:hypothetical protein